MSDGSSGGSVTVSQLEVFTLTHQLKIVLEYM